MFDHISIGVSDLGAACKFYDAALAPLGYTRLGVGDTWAGYGRDSIGFYLLASTRPVPPNADSGLHFCFVAPSRAAVADFHAAALRLNAHDNGSPGLRTDYGPDYFAAFVIDPEGYRLEAHCADNT
ncbi:MAG: VOC family protein [Rhodocyclales bacterium]|nr:VOC family protein [Rhodocyclales bacterium]